MCLPSSTSPGRQGRHPLPSDLDILELCTHNPRKRGSTVDLYTTFPWNSLCGEVAKLQLRRAPRAELVALPLAVGGEGAGPATRHEAKEQTAFATSLATVGEKGDSSRHDKLWRRRESNPGPEVLH